MKVILLETIKNFGNKGNIINVKSGFARNFLIPKGKAILGTKKNIEVYENKKIQLEKEFISQLSIAKSRAKQIKSFKNIVIYAKSGVKGKLFGSIGSKEISYAISKLGMIVNKHEIKLINGKIRVLGEHELIFQPHSEISIVIKVTVLTV